MVTMSVENIDIPSHVSRDRVVDFDMYREPGLLKDPHKFLADLVGRAPDFFYTPHNGGHWVALGPSVVEHVFENYELFSPVDFHGIPAPATPPAKRVFIPPAMNPPEHTAHRRLLNPLFTPSAVAALEPSIRELCVSLIEGVRRRGTCEFVADIATPFPVRIFMRQLGLPEERQDEFLSWANERWLRPNDSNARQNSIRKVREYLSELLEERTRNPQGDWISQMATAEIDGKRLDREDILLPMCTTLFYSGLDTVRHSLSFFIGLLAGRPDLQLQLHTEPGLAGDATEELLRVRGVLSPGRSITRDESVFGASVRRGELVLISLPTIGYYDRHVAEPLRVDFRRKDRRHATFGMGAHRCAGAALARREMAIFLQEWSSRIPSFRVQSGFTPAFGAGHMLSIPQLPLEWSQTNADVQSGGTRS
jgi:cytochrome P450